jgi:hypothetical protein
VKHYGNGSEISPGLSSLISVNSIRYIERYHGLAVLFRAVVAFIYALAYATVDRRGLAIILNRRRRQDCRR